MHEKKSQFILLKIPPNLLNLLGKIHALSIEVLVSAKAVVQVDFPAYALSNHKANPS